MEPIEEYQDPILRKYAKLISSKTSRFKRIFYGDPIRIAASEMPVLIMSKIDTRVTNHTNVEDLHQIRISFTVVTDVRDTISEDKEMVRGTNALYNLMEGRNEDYTLKPESLLGILRHSVELDVGNNLRTDLSTASNISYGLAMGKRQEGAWSTEGVLEISANFTQIR